MRLDYQVNNRPSTTKSQVDPATLRPHKKPCGLAAAGFKELGAIYPAPGCLDHLPQQVHLSFFKVFSLVLIDVVVRSIIQAKQWMMSLRLPVPSNLSMNESIKSSSSFSHGRDILVQLERTRSFHWFKFALRTRVSP